MNIISEMLDSLKENHPDKKIPVEDIQVIRLVGLLHDLGHLPLSHVFEYSMEKSTGRKHEDITKYFIEHSIIQDILTKYKINTELLMNILNKKYIPTEDSQINYVSLYDGNLDADKMDYLKRDSINTGVGYGSIDIDRILETITIDDAGSLCMSYKGRLALENLFIARYHMFQTVYLHKSVVAFELMINKIYEKLVSDPDDPILQFNTIFEMNEKQFSSYDDAYIWYKINHYSGKNEYINELIRMLMSHQSIKLAGEEPLLTEQGKRVKRRLNVIESDAYKKILIERIEGFDLEWLFCYNTKIKFRKAESESPIKIEIENKGQKRYIDIAEVEYSIMNPLKTEFTNYLVYTHPKCKDNLKNVLQELELIQNL